MASVLWTFLILSATSFAQTSERLATPEPETKYNRYTSAVEATERTTARRCQTMAEQYPEIKDLLTTTPTQVREGSSLLKSFASCYRGGAKGLDTLKEFVVDSASYMAGSFKRSSGASAGRLSDDSKWKAAACKASEDCVRKAFHEAYERDPMDGELKAIMKSQGDAMMLKLERDQYARLNSSGSLNQKDRAASDATYKQRSCAAQKRNNPDYKCDAETEKQMGQAGSETRQEYIARMRRNYAQGKGATDPYALTDPTFENNSAMLAMKAKIKDSVDFYTCLKEDVKAEYECYAATMFLVPAGATKLTLASLPRVARLIGAVKGGGKAAQLESLAQDAARNPMTKGAFNSSKPPTRMQDIWKLSDADRKAVAEKAMQEGMLLRGSLTETQKDAIVNAHNQSSLMDKVRTLDAAGLNKEQRDFLLREGFSGTGESYPTVTTGLRKQDYGSKIDVGGEALVEVEKNVSHARDLLKAGKTSEAKQFLDQAAYSSRDIKVQRQLYMESGNVKRYADSVFDLDKLIDDGLDASKLKKGQIDLQNELAVLKQSKAQLEAERLAAEKSGRIPQAGERFREGQHEHREAYDYPIRVRQEAIEQIKLDIERIREISD